MTNTAVIAWVVDAGATVTTPFGIYSALVDILTSHAISRVPLNARTVIKNERIGARGVVATVMTAFLTLISR